MMVVQSDKMKILSPQGVNSTTWVPPPFYGSLTIPELYAFHAEKSPEHPIFAYDDEQGETQKLHYKEVFPAIRKAAKFVSRHVPTPKTTAEEGPEGSNLGVLAIADSITLLTLYIGMMYLGHGVFPLSIRNSAVAIAHLTRRTALRHLFVSHDPAMQRLADEAKDILTKEGYEIEIVPLPEFRDLYNESKEGLDIEMAPQNDEKTCLILHSSGSTSFPKPVPFPHRHFTRWGFLSSFGDFDLCGSHVGMHSLPQFHIMGCVCLTWAVCTGVVISVFRPSSPPITVTPDNVLQAMLATNCEFLVCVPAMLEAWSRKQEAVEHLKKFKSILYAGAPLNQEIGDRLIQQGVKIMTGFGATEVGAVVKLMVDTTKIPMSDWEYFSFSPPVEFIRVFQEGLPHVFEPVVVDSPTWSPNIFNTQIDGRPAYAMSDLLEEHPTKPNLYRFYGRIDDQIALSTGEKASSSPASSS
ncbi:hypothetical protein BN946_scf185034.g6 [Trametes cinnabarina]|uniref:AMP-dependent synthetase/ligase domain-containing protein n=1 Tax=Pycnoporus cinnabarinus TaxID=5643 RepID=A0A060SUM4_PYCCI|nr:hypothetical protein BN946_scf185034.g6 [Trametes cinnabarina]